MRAGRADRSDAGGPFRHDQNGPTRIGTALEPDTGVGGAMGERKPVSPEDAAVWQQLLAGDSDAMTIVIARHRRVLICRAATLCGERPPLPMTAEDVFSETCRRFHRLSQLVRELARRNDDAVQRAKLWQQLYLSVQQKQVTPASPAENPTPQSVVATGSHRHWLQKLLESDSKLRATDTANPRWWASLTQLRQQILATLRKQSADQSQFDHEWSELQQRFAADLRVSPAEASEEERDEEFGLVNDEELLKWLRRLKEIKPLLASATPEMPADWPQIIEQILSRRGATFHVRGWLFKVLKNVVKDERKRCAREARRRKESSEEAVDETELATSEHDPLLLELRIQAIQDCLQQLRDKELHVVYLRLAGWKNTEISQVLEMPDNTVASHWNRALIALKPCVWGKLRND
jgi:RNA polymerase sigma factor (sigma-70 family)